MKANRALNVELRRLVEARLQQTLRGIEDTLNQIIANQETTVKELKQDLKSLEPSFNILLQKWSLEILYTLFLKTAPGFGELKKILGVNSRTLSDKLKTLKYHGYIERDVSTGPPLRVNYKLTAKGKSKSQGHAQSAYPSGCPWCQHHRNQDLHGPGV
jgi:DNA-binding HxlR family transcriptional regulator